MRQINVNQLVQQLRQTRDWDTRIALMKEIAELGVDAVPPLIEILALFPDPESYFGEDSDASLHSITEDILMLIGKPTVDYLTPLLRSENWGMRHGAIWVLDHVHDVRAIEPLIASLDSVSRYEASGEVQRDQEVIDALRNFGDLALEPLITALHHENVYIRGNAAFTLRDFDDPRLPPLLIALAEEDPTLFVRSSATYALGNFPYEAVGEMLMRLADDPIQEVRSSAISALGHLPNEAVGQLLIRLTDDPIADIRSDTIWALKDFPSDDVTQVLQRLTHDPDPEISELATDMLNEREKKSNDQ